MRRLFIAALTFLVGLAIVAIPTNASADEPRDCYSWSCTFMDPAETNCVDDAVTIARYGVRNEGGTYGNLDLRYSKKCHSNWVRFSSDSGLRTLFQIGTHMAVSGAQPWIWRSNPGLSPQGLADQAFGTFGSSYWTTMITADGTTCMSVDVITQDPLPGQNEFTPGTGRVKQNFNGPCVS